VYQVWYFWAGTSLQSAKIRSSYSGRVLRTYLGLSTGWKDTRGVCPDS